MPASSTGRSICLTRTAGRIKGLEGQAPAWPRLSRSTGRLASPVRLEAYSPISLQNGLALSRTVHWVFDHGILSLEDDGRILAAESLLPESLRRMLGPDGYVHFPDEPARRPHPQFLRFHREVVFRG